MKLNDNYVLYELGDDKVLVCLDSRQFSGVIKLNSTAAFIVGLMKEEISKDKLAEAIVDHYSDVDTSKALTAIDSVLDSLKDTGAINF